MATNKGIPVINNFDLYSNKAIDSRLTIENEQELGELVNKGAIYDGMIFYRKDAQKFFQAQYLESGLKISEFGGSSEESVILHVDAETLNINYTKEQFDKIIKDKNLIIEFRGVYMSCTNYTILEQSGTTICQCIVNIFDLNDKGKVDGTLFGFALKSNITSVQLTVDGTIGYLLPDINELDITKYFIPQVFNGSITWVEKASDSDTAVITLSDSQALEMNSGKITFTQEQFEIIKKQGFIKVQYKEQDIISGNSTYYNVNKGYTLAGLFLNTSVGNGVVSIYVPSNYNYTQLGISIEQIVKSVNLFALGNTFYVQYNEDKTPNLYVDDINNIPIIHEDETEIRHYTIPTITFVD